MPRFLPLLALTVLAVPALSGCASSGSGDGLSIVASTSVYGDIAAAIAGDAADVTSIISSTVQDPHSFEVTARDRLALENADLVIYNGGGYDDFVTRILDPLADGPQSIEAVAVADLGDENEHVWYDLGAVAEIAEAIADELADLDPQHADSFQANADSFAQGIADIQAELATLHDRAAGLGVIVTEHVPAYLLADAGLVDVTPAGFSSAIEEGADVAPALLADVLRTITDGDASIVASNSQTAGPETERVIETADDAGVPVIEFTETLPDGLSYLDWMTGNVAALAAALP